MTMKEKIERYAKQAEELRVEALYDDDIVDDHFKGKGAHYFILALSTLETAHQFLRLAALETDQ